MYLKKWGEIKKSYCKKFVFAKTLAWCKTALPKLGKAITEGEWLTILSFHWWFYIQSEMLERQAELLAWLKWFIPTVEMWICKWWVWGC